MFARGDWGLISSIFLSTLSAHADNSYAAKRMRKLTQRRAVDYTSTIVRYVQVFIIASLNNHTSAYFYLHMCGLLAFMSSELQLLPVSINSLFTWYLILDTFLPLWTFVQLCSISCLLFSMVSLTFKDTWSFTIIFGVLLYFSFPLNPFLVYIILKIKGNLYTVEGIHTKPPKWKQVKFLISPPSLFIAPFIIPIIVYCSPHIFPAVPCSSLLYPPRSAIMPQNYPLDFWNNSL